MTLAAYIESHDLLMAGAMIAASLAVWAASRWFYYDQRQRAVQREIDALPPIDYSIVRPPQPIHFSTLPDLKAREMAHERQRLALVIGSSSKEIH